jgi:hypothetical protein
VTVITVRCGASHRTVSGLQDGLARLEERVRNATCGGDQRHIFNGAEGSYYGALAVWIAADAQSDLGA